MKKRHLISLFFLAIFLNLATVKALDIQFVSPTENSSAISNLNFIQINVTSSDVNLTNITICLYNVTGNLINYTYTSTSPNYANFSGLIEGIYFFNATALNSSSFSNSTETRNITIDTTNPAINFTSPTENESFINRKNILINATITDTNFKNVTINLYNLTGLVNSTSSANASLFLNFTNLAEGIYFFNITSYDLAGNSNSTGTRNVTIDTINPDINFTNLTEISGSIINTNKILINITVSDANLANITINLYNSTKDLVNSSSNNNFCYQETVNQSAAGDGNCNLNYSGSYAIVGTWSNANGLYDGSWVDPNRGYVASQGSSGIFYINYSKPANVINGTLWQVKVQNSSIPINPVTVNITIPDDCLNQNLNVLQLSIIVNFDKNFPNDQNNSINETCWNGTDWKSLLKTQGIVVWEEAIIWNIQFSGFTNLADGLYFFNATVYDFAGNSNSTETRNVTIDTIPAQTAGSGSSTIGGSGAGCTEELDCSAWNACISGEQERTCINTGTCNQGQSIIQKRNCISISPELPLSKPKTIQPQPRYPLTGQTIAPAVPLGTSLLGIAAIAIIIAFISWKIIAQNSKKKRKTKRGEK